MAWAWQQSLRVWGTVLPGGLPSRRSRSRLGLGAAQRPLSFAAFISIRVTCSFPQLGRWPPDPQSPRTQAPWLFCPWRPAQPPPRDLLQKDRKLQLLSENLLVKSTKFTKMCRMSLSSWNTPRPRGAPFGNAR